MATHNYKFEYNGNNYQFDADEGLSEDQLIKIAENNSQNFGSEKATPKMTKWEFVGRNALKGISDTVDFIGNALAGGDLPMSEEFKYRGRPEQAALAKEDAAKDQAYDTRIQDGKPLTSAAIRAASGALMTGPLDIGAAPAIGRSLAQSGRQIAYGAIGAGGLGAGQQALVQSGHELLAEFVNLVPSPVQGAKAALTWKLRRTEARANPPREANALAGAKALFPSERDTWLAQNNRPNPYPEGDNLTVSQTSGSPSVRTFASGGSGRAGQVASANQMDALGDNLIKQANNIAPLPLKTPEVADQIASAIQKHDDNMKLVQKHTYDAGVTSVTALQSVSPANVTLNNLIKSYDSIVAQGTDIFKLAPTQLSPETQRLLEFLKGAPMGGARLKYVKPLGAMAIGKALNELYDSAPRGALTPAMDDAFKSLKAAYKKDIDDNIAGPVINQSLIEMKRVNDIYSKLSEKRDKLRNSVVNSVLGKDAIRDPDKALDTVVRMNPVAQKYTRGILEAYAPDTLDALRSYAIERHVQDAMQKSGPSFQSKFNETKISPQILIDSGLYSKAQATKLIQNEQALSVVLNQYFKEAKGSSGEALGPTPVGRVVGGGFNPIFTSGMLLKLMTNSRIDKLLNTPEGRNNLMAGAYGTGSSKAAALARRAIIENITQIMKEDNENAQDQ